MKKITLFYDGAWYTLKWLKAMLWAKEEFRELGYEVSFLNKEQYICSRDKVQTFEEDALNYEYDIVFLAHHPSHVSLYSIEYERFAHLMERLKNQCNKIVWLDTTDSAGTLWKGAFPFVDLYFKKQIQIDLSQYMKKMWGGRLYTQYYYENKYIDGEEFNEDDNAVLTPQELEKIRVSWNVGLGELFEEKEISVNNPYKIFTPKFVSPDTDRKYDVQYKGTLEYSMCGYQRLKSTELVSKSNLVHPDLFKIVPYNEYLREISESKAVISPFGWGEICTRDFEAFLQGAVLIKPDMSHLLTFPNWYTEYQTYIPHKWDFSDFIEVITKTKESDAYKGVAQNAQDRFNYYRNMKEGREEFASHIIYELER